MSAVSSPSAAFAVLPAQSAARLSAPTASQVATARPAEGPANHSQASTFALVSCAAMVVGGSRMRRRARAVRPAVRALVTRKAVMEKTTGETVGSIIEREDIRNMAIIAHVDHGKTTLTDALMKQTGMEVASMDSDAQEMERGITILAKNAAINYKDVKINIIDTPGHADFGGEVERILNMADACLLLVDAQEGPMPQTKFVLTKALELQKRVLVCINKVDKPAARPDWVLDTTFDLFVALGADDELADFPVCYASGIQGKSCIDDPNELGPDLYPMLDMILNEVPKPKVEPERPLQMLVANLDYDDYLGRISIGRVTSGSVKVGDSIGLMYGENGEIRTSKIKELFQFENNGRSPVTEVKAGDICAFTGMDDVTIGDTVVDPKNPLPLPPIEVEEPTVTMEFGVNLSPTAGRDGDKMTGSLIKKRLQKECMTNLAIRVEDGGSDAFKVKGRGILQLGVLIENMKREGFELMIGAPEVIVQTDPDTGAKQEPYEEASVEVPSEYQGVVMDSFQKKGGIMLGMEPGATDNSLVFQFEIPTQGMIGMQGKMMQATRGQATMSSQFSKWGEIKESMKLREKGSIVNVGSGPCTTYALMKLDSRGTFWAKPGDELYEGQCVGIHNKQGDMEANVTKAKQLNNMRAGGYGSDSKDQCSAGISMNLDDFLGHMDTDECLEVTPKNLRLIKRNSKALKKK